MENEDFKVEDQELDPIEEYVNSKRLVNPTELKSKFTPILSGSFSRNLVKEKIRPDNASSTNQLLGIQYKPATNNVNVEVFGKTVQFPQPSVIGMGSITSAGAKSTDRPFFSQNWAVSKTGTGVYRVDHLIGDKNYIVTAVSNTINVTCSVTSVENDYFTISTYDMAGVATDCDTTFMVYAMI